MLKSIKKSVAGALTGLFMLAAAGPVLAQEAPPQNPDPIAPAVTETQNAPATTPVTITQSTDGKSVTINLTNANVTIGNAPPANDNGGGSPLTGLLFNVLLFVGLPIAAMVWLQRRAMKGGAGGAMGVGKSKAKLASSMPTVTLKDVAGVDEAKADMLEIVDFLKNPHKYEKMNAKMPRGVLFSGPPGTGKTLMAKAMAGEAGVPFYSISGSDFVEMFVGVGAARVRDMFAEAKKNAPCIIFIDEIDAVGRQRGSGMNGGNDERENTLNQLLVEMDGFEKNEGIVMIGATNRVDILDKALLRPGRFDRQIVVPNPDMKGREAILKVHVRKVPLNADVSLNVIARGTPGFSGADLENLVNEAALLAIKRKRDDVSRKEFDDAKDKILMGAERPSLVMTEQEKRMTAYHEGGHALIALTTPECDPVHKATIMPRGQALGMVMSLPEDDRVSMSFAKAKAQLKLLMGGRVAEEIMFGKEQVSNGASGDIQMATRLATAMVAHWGMSEKIGMVQIQNEHLGAAHVQAEVKRLTEEAYKAAKDEIEKNIDILHRFAKGLLEHETLTGAQLKDLKEGKSIVTPAAAPDFDKAAADEPSGSNETPGRAPDNKPDTGPVPSPA